MVHQSQNEDQEEDLEPGDPRLLLAITALLMGEAEEEVRAMLEDEGVSASLARWIVRETRRGMERDQRGREG